MHGEGHRLVADPITAFSGPEAEIDIFKPDRAEAFVEAAQAGPGLAPDQQEGAGGLFRIAGLRHVHRCV